MVSLTHAYVCLSSDVWNWGGRFECNKWMNLELEEQFGSCFILNHQSINTRCQLCITTVATLSSVYQVWLSNLGIQKWIKTDKNILSHWKKAHPYWNVAFTSTNLLWELSLMSSWNSNQRIPCGGLFRAACCSSSFVDTFLSFVTYFVTWDGYHQFGSVSVGVYNFLFFFFFKVGKFPLRKWKSWYFVFIFSLLRGKICSILFAC